MVGNLGAGEDFGGVRREAAVVREPGEEDADGREAAGDRRVVVAGVLLVAEEGDDVGALHVAQGGRAAARREIPEAGEVVAVGLAGVFGEAALVDELVEEGGDFGGRGR